MNRSCSMKKLFSKISQHSPENNCLRVSSLIKMQALRSATLSKMDSNTVAFLWTAASESFSFYVSLKIFLHEQITASYIGSEENTFSKKKEKLPFSNSGRWKTCLFMMFFIISFFSICPPDVRQHLPYIIKDDSSEGL